MGIAALGGLRALLTGRRHDDFTELARLGSGREGGLGHCEQDHQADASRHKALRGPPASASTLTVQSLSSHSPCSSIFFHTARKMLELIHVPVSFLLAKWKGAPANSVTISVSTSPGLSHVDTSLYTLYASQPKMLEPRKRLVLRSSRS